MLDLQGIIELGFTRLFLVGSLLVFSKISPLFPDQLRDLSYGEIRALSSDHRSSYLAVEHVARERLLDADEVGINLLLLFLLFFRGLCWVYSGRWLCLFDGSYSLLLCCLIFFLCLMLSTILDDILDSLLLWLILIEEVRKIVEEFGGKLETLR